MGTADRRGLGKVYGLERKGCEVELLRVDETQMTPTECLLSSRLQPSGLSSTLSRFHFMASIAPATTDE